jgi:membrane-bound ClpP family serine protease
MKTIIITLIIIFVIFEIIEHVVLPLLSFGMKRNKKSMGDQFGMIGRVAEVREWKNREGHVSVNGELWRAVSSTPLVPSSKAVIQDVKGLTLTVEVLKEQ